jgi:hypothetical protein
MKKHLLFAFCLLMVFGSQGQELNDGLYLSVEDLLYNDPVPPTYLINQLDIRENNYLDNVVGLDSIRYYNREEMEAKIANHDLWGYCKNGIPYLNFDDQFARVQVVGSICHFTSIIEVVNFVPDPFDRMGMSTPVVSKEIVENMIDLASGKAERFTDDAFLNVLQRDGQLYREFLGLKPKEQKQKKFRFLTRYNERNPFKFEE